MTKKEICQTLRRRGWRRTNWRWTNLRPGYPAFAKKGVDLRGAASLEALESSEDLTERPYIRTPTAAQYRAAEINIALAHCGGSIVSCPRCGWPVWVGTRCKCGHLTK